MKKNIKTLERQPKTTLQKIPFPPPKYKFIQNKTDIIAWLDEYNIIDYELIEDDKYGYIVNVNGVVDLFNKELVFIPVKFNMVNGSFNCGMNKLASLVGCPKTVGGSFSCHYNKLSSLAPKEIPLRSILSYRY